MNRLCSVFSQILKLVPLTEDLFGGSSTPGCLEVMVLECFDQARISTGVYNDAHANWSIVMSRLSSGDEKMS